MRPSYPRALGQLWCLLQGQLQGQLQVAEPLPAPRPEGGVAGPHGADLLQFGAARGLSVPGGGVALQLSHLHTEGVSLPLDPGLWPRSPLPRRQLRAAD